MRTVFVLMSLSALATPALAGEPGTCEQLSAAEDAASEAKIELERLKEMAFGVYYKDRMAHVSAEKRDQMVADREDARQTLPDARESARDARQKLREARKGAKSDGVVCTPARDETTA